MADVASLIVDLRLRDNLTGGIASAKDALGNFGDSARVTAANVGDSFKASATSAAGSFKDAFAGVGSEIKKGIGLGIGIGVAAEAAQAAGAIKSFFADSVAAATEEEAGIRRLTASLQANVPAYDGNINAIERTVAAREKLAFSDDELRTSLSTLVGATHDVGKAFDIQQTAMDLARFKGVDLQTATDALIRVEGGQYRALKGLGIVLKEGATQTDALAAVQKVAAGQAEAFGNTTAGAMKAAEIAVHDLQEEIGVHLAPVVKAGADVVTNSLVPALELAVKGFDRLASGSPEFRSSVHENSIQSDILASALGAVGQALTGLPPDTQRWIDAAKAASAELDTTATTAEGADRKLISLSATMTTGASTARLYADAVNLAANAAAGAAPPTITLTRSLDGAHDAAIAGAAAENDWATAAAKAAAIAQGYGDDVSYLGTALSSTAGLHELEHDQALKSADALDTAATAAIDLATQLNAIPKDIQVNVKTTFRTAGDAFDTTHTGPTGQGPGGMTSGEYYIEQQDTREKDARDRQAAADEAARTAKAAREKADREALAAAKEQARKEAAAYKDALNNAFDAAKRTANSLFDTLHNRHLQAIKDAETLAQKQHDAALQLIADNLKAAQTADAAPVTAAEKALRDREDAQRRRDLVESLQAAQKAASENRDPSQAASLAQTLRAATEALQNFDAQAAIDRLKAVQGGLDAAAQATADTATANADAALAAAKAKAQADTDAETVANRKRQDDFDIALKALREKDLKEGRTPAQQKADIAALEARFGITTDPVTGIHHITDPLVTAIMELRASPPTFVNNFKPSFRVFIGAREVAAALAAGQQPAATASIRTGAAGRV